VLKRVNRAEVQGKGWFPFSIKNRPLNFIVDKGTSDTLYHSYWTWLTSVVSLLKKKNASWTFAPDASYDTIHTLETHIVAHIVNSKVVLTPDDAVFFGCQPQTVLVNHATQSQMEVGASEIECRIGYQIGGL